MTARMNRRISPLLLVVFAAIFISVVVGFALSWHHQQLILEFKNDALERASVLGTSLANAANSRLALLQGLRAFALNDLTLSRMDDDFEAYASVLAASMDGVRTLTVSPGGIHRFVFPLAGNEGVLGHNLMMDERAHVREDVSRAIATGAVSISGPYELRQGGLGLVARQAVFEEGEFWGFVALVLDVEPLLVEAGLGTLPEDMLFALVDGESQLIAGSQAIVGQDSVSHSIALPEGEWQLHLLPVGEWSRLVVPPFHAVAVPAVVGTCLLIALLFSLPRQNARLTRTVAERTEKLLASEARWRSLVEDSPDYVLTLDKNLEIEFANRPPPGLVMEDILGRPLYEFLSSSDQKRVRGLLTDVLNTRVAARYETSSEVDGQVICFESRAVPRVASGGIVGLTVVARDITALKKTQMEVLGIEAHLRQSQKLESLGTLASGVAHEINNPLMGMMNYAELAKRHVDGDTAEGYLEEICNEGSRIARIVRNLLSFSRQENEAPHPADLADIVDAALSLVGAVLRKDQIAIELEIPDNLPQVTCRSQQIQQVIINLLTNARNALNQRYAGFHANKTVHISARPFTKERSEWVRMTIEDHGAGMEDEVVRRIFDPFFTTKPRDEGTGLGLSVSYGIVKDHRGELSVESAHGEFTRFYMDLPVHGEASSPIEAG